MAFSRNLITAVWALAQLVASQTVNMAPPGTVPSDASQLVDHTFPCFAIQVSSFPAYTSSNGQPNQFTQNLLNAISNRTGTGCVIRVGGTNGDSAKYNASQTEPVVIPPSQSSKPLPQNLTLGPSLFKGFAQIQNTKWVFTAPFANANLSLSITETQLALQNAGAQNINAFEIGNEIDFYPGTHRPSNWTPADYVAQWTQYANAILGNLTLPSRRIFQAPALASAGHGDFTITNVFNAGINSNNLIKSASDHYYQTAAGTGSTLSSKLLNHSFIMSGLNTFKPSIAYLRQNQANLPFVLGETGRYTGSGSTANELGNFAGALWTVDMMLYAMTLNVTRINMQLGYSFGFSAFIPIDSQLQKAGVRAPYYAHLFIAELLGTASNVRVALLPVSSDSFAAYGVYTGTALAKIALINLTPYAGGGAARPSRQVNIALPRGTSSLTAQRLQAPDVGQISNVTWNGMQWSYPSGTATKVGPGASTVPVTNNAASLSIPASEAVLVTLGS